MNEFIGVTYRTVGDSQVHQMAKPHSLSSDSIWISWNQNWYKLGLRVLPSVKSGEVTAGSGNKPQTKQI